MRKIFESKGLSGKKFNPLRFWLLVFVSFGIALSLSSALRAASNQGNAMSQGDNEFAKLRIRKIEPAEAAHDFTLNEIHGSSVSLGAFRGKIVFLNFWATWCPPCRTEMPSMERLYRQLKGSGLVMLAADLKENKKQVTDFMREFALTFPALLDTDGRVSRRYGIVGLPATYIIDRKGRLIGHKPGSRDWATANTVELFRKLLAVGNAPEFPAESAVTALDTPPLPPLLYVKANGIALHAQQDRSSGTVARPSRGEKLYPLGKASGGGETWYMVKTQQGLIGWIRAGDVGEQVDTRP